MERGKKQQSIKSPRRKRKAFETARIAAESVQSVDNDYVLDLTRGIDSLH